MPNNKQIEDRIVEILLNTEIEIDEAASLCVGADFSINRIANFCLKGGISEEVTQCLLWKVKNLSIDPTKVLRSQLILDEVRKKIKEDLKPNIIYRKERRNREWGFYSVRDYYDKHSPDENARVGGSRARSGIRQLLASTMDRGKSIDWRAILFKLWEWLNKAARGTDISNYELKLVKKNEEDTESK